MAAMTREAFFKALAPTVIRIRQEGSTLLPSVRLAQALLETGGVIHSWYNLGGIKVGGGSPNKYWRGEAIVKGTWEYVDGRSVDAKAAFRVYSSVYHFYKDQDLLFASQRYARVRAAGTAELQAQMLLACGYATDPAYASKLLTIINQYNLKQYDALSQPTQPTGIFKDAGSVAVLMDGLVVSSGYYVAGTVWVPARALGEALGAAIGWTGTKVTVNGKELASQLDVRTGYVMIRELAAEVGKKAFWEQATYTVTLQ